MDSKLLLTTRWVGPIQRSEAPMVKVVCAFHSMREEHSKEVNLGNAALVASAFCCEFNTLDAPPMIQRSLRKSAFTLIPWLGIERNFGIEMFRLVGR